MNFNNHLANAIVPEATSAFSIPIKIYDGLFMADHYIAQDVQFFETNLITHVINCAGQQVQNSQKVSGVAFLTFDWSESAIQNITQQKVVSVTVNFIQQCRKQSGCLLINYSSSESRPFCLLACYFMVRFKWSLFKTLQFLNSRKEDVQLQPAFFQQLTAFAQKLQDKGLIRSKTWVIGPGMSDQEIIITNTYLNSKNKFGNVPQSNNNKTKNKNSITWKKDIVIQHTYCPNSIIHDRNQKMDKNQKAERQKIERAEKLIQRKSLAEQPKNNERISNNNSRQKREDSLKKSQKQLHQPQPLQSHSQNILNSQSYTQPQSQMISQHHKNILNQQKGNNSTSMTQMNVTRKWAELREMWLREKQNHNAGNSNQVPNNNSQYSEVSQKQQTPIIMKKDGQRINDRLQQKLNLLKKHQQKLQLQNSTRPGSKKQNSEIMITEKNNNESDRAQLRPTQKERQKINSHNSRLNQQVNSRIMHNNWIIDNQVVGDQNGNKNSKSKLVPNTTNKSVIIVKPNHGSSSLDIKNNDKMRDSSLFNSNGALNQGTSNNPSRSSLRKVAGSDRKQQNNSSLNKQNSGAKFFRNQATDIISTKGRCSSAKPQRKDNISSVALGLGLTKNGSLKGKGKWKF